MIQKIYSLWNALKQKVEKKEFIPFFSTQEVWWVYMGKNIGFEQDGKNAEFSRPVVILSLFGKHLFVAIPLTSKMKEGKYYFPFEDSRGRKQTAILSQLRVFSSKRLKEKISDMPIKSFREMKKRVKKLL